MSESKDLTNRYDTRNIDCMEMVYGEGFMAPGGPEDVARIVAGIDLRECKVLDVGCGLGGAVATLVKDLKARSVIGIDIDEVVLDRARALMNRIGIDDRVELQCVEPGGLPFGKAAFDVAYMNSVSCHFEDLERIFNDLYRVLRPNGVVVGGEWFIGDNRDAFVRWDEFLHARGLNFYFVTCEHYLQAIEAAGFREANINDRTEFVKISTQQEIANVNGA